MRRDLALLAVHNGPRCRSEVLVQCPSLLSWGPDRRARPRQGLASAASSASAAERLAFRELEAAPGKTLPESAAPVPARARRSTQVCGPFRGAAVVRMANLRTTSILDFRELEDRKPKRRPAGFRATTQPPVPPRRGHALACDSDSDRPSRRCYMPFTLSSLARLSPVQATAATPVCCLDSDRQQLRRPGSLSMASFFRVVSLQVLDGVQVTSSEGARCCLSTWRCASKLHLLDSHYNSCA